MVTFNHAAYVAQAIESVLAQVMDFDVELVIGEDDSTDDTRQIVQAYQRQHPERIDYCCTRQRRRPGECAGHAAGLPRRVRGAARRR